MAPASKCVTGLASAIAARLPRSGHRTTSTSPSHDDQPWNDHGSLQINCQFPYSQALGNAIFALAGIPPQDTAIVQVRVNGANLAQSGALMYGRYARLEGRGREWTQRHFPNDPDGNFYRLDDHDPGAVNVPAGQPRQRRVPLRGHARRCLQRHLHQGNQPGRERLQRPGESHADP